MASRIKQTWKDIRKFQKKHLNFANLCRLIYDPSCLWIAGIFMFMVEVVLNIIILRNVKYTEIDWKTYMQQVELFLNGTRDYKYIEGDTGPLVYPAGFLYIFSGLYYLTGHGTNIRLAQLIFVVLYLVNLALVFRIYHMSCKIPPYVLLFICLTSYRIHSIFALRLFNDPVAVCLLYAAINMFISDRWKLGCMFYSIAVSVKMNILLYAPALLILLLSIKGFVKTVLCLSICAVVQLVLAAPFLLANPWSYLGRSFDLGRVFLHKWTVNWRFLPESLFLDKNLHLFLLGLHVAVLLLFFWTRWFLYFKLAKEKVKIVIYSANFILLPLFTANFIGMCFSRSLHYQFYIWYYHSLPYLLWSTDFTNVTRICILGMLEMCWNTYPSTEFSSACLHVCHFTLLARLWLDTPGPKVIQGKTEKAK